MSIQKQKRFTCPQCTTPNNLDWSGSLNFDRNPDLIQKVLDDTLCVIKCTNCKISFRIEPDFPCFYLTKKYWIVAHPIQLLPQWSDLEKRAFNTFDLALGEKAPSSAAELGKDVSPRIVFGWPALREKILIIQLGLNETAVELAKMIILQNVGPHAINYEYRLVDTDQDNLIFDSIHLTNRTPEAEQFALLKSTLLDVENDPAAWSELKQKVTSGIWLDAMRCFK